MFLCSLQQVQKQVTFPKDESISDSCKHMIIKLLSPLKVRLSISEIKNQPWIQQAVIDQSGSKKTGKIDTANVEL